MPRLSIERGDDEGSEFVLRSGEKVVIGRDESATITLSDQMASRKHCLIGESKGAWLIRDLESVNGTRINGKKIPSGKTYRLRNGTSFEIGESLIVYYDEVQSGESDPLIGELLGGYKVERRLGRGAMGVVYQAHQISLGRDVALKVLSEEISDDTRFKEMFISEARAAARLNHQNILQVYDVGEDDGRVFMSMEIAPQGTVLEELRRAGVLDEKRTIAIIRDALKALSYAQEKGIVHRDIKPDNLMIGDGGVVKLGDLGLAKSADELDGEKGGVFGTPHYIAPEQAQGKSIDHRADLYALGATWYRLLSGRTLFSGGNVREILKNQVRTPHRPLRDLDDVQIDSAISAIVDRMLAKNPDERYQSAAEILNDVDIYVANRGQPQSISTASESGLLQVEASPKGGVPLPVLIALVVVALGGGIAAAAMMMGDKDGDSDNSGVVANTSNQAPGPSANTSPEADTSDRILQDEMNRHLKEATELVKSSDLGDVAKGLAQLQELIDRWPESTQAANAKELIELIRARQRAESVNSNDPGKYRKLWDEILESVATDWLPGWDLAAALNAMESLEQELKDHENEQIRALVADLGIVAKRQEVRKAFEKRMDARLQELSDSCDAVEEASRKSGDLERWQTRIADILVELAALKKDTDHPVFKTQITEAESHYAERERACREAILQRDTEIRNAAYDRSAKALGEALGSVRQALRAGDFKAAEDHLVRFEKSIDYMTFVSHPTFAPLKALIADRRWQNRLEQDAMTWLLGNWESGVFQLDELAEACDAFTRVFAEYESIGLSADNGETLAIAFRGKKPDDTSHVQGLRVALKDYSSNDTSLVVEHLLEGLGSTSRGKLFLKDRGWKTHRAGIAAWLLESDLIGWAEPNLMEHFRTLNEPESKRRGREFAARILLLKAERARESGNLKDAADLLGELQRDFGDTRVWNGPVPKRLE